MVVLLVHLKKKAEVFRGHFTKLFSQTPSHEDSVVDASLQLPIFEGIDHAPTDEGNHGCCKKLKNRGPGYSGLLARRGTWPSRKLQTYRSPGISLQDCSNNIT